jgi:hypothetical protein
MNHLKNIVAVLFASLLLTGSVAVAASITPINGSDTISGSRATLNNNFNSLNGAKVEIGGDLSGTTTTPRLSVSSQATGTLLYYNHSLWIAFPTGTVGYVLTVTSTAPFIAWQPATVSGGLVATNNLSDLTSTSSARTNIGYTAVSPLSISATGVITFTNPGYLATTTLAFATSTGSNAFNVTLSGTTYTIKIPSNVSFFSNDAGYVTSSVIVGYLQGANNLSDLASTSTARTNLGLNNSNQSCAGGQFVNALSATTTIGCGTPSGGGGGSGGVATSGTPIPGQLSIFFDPNTIMGATSTNYNSSTGMLTIGSGTSTTYLSGSGVTSTFNIVAPPDCNAVFAGDSITAGTGATTTKDWPTQLMSLPFFKNRCHEYNKGVGGFRISDLIGHYTADIHPEVQRLRASLGTSLCWVESTILSLTTPPPPPHMRPCRAISQRQKQTGTK